MTPTRLSGARAVVQGARSVTLAAAVAAGVLLVGTTVLAILAEELLGDANIDLLARGAMGSLGIIVVIAWIGEPLRFALARVLLARDAAAMPEGTTPPAAERRALRDGPHGAMMVAGVACIIIGGVLLPIGLLLATDDREALLARILLPTLSALALAAGILILVLHRGKGRARPRWRARVDGLNGRWGPAVEPVPRAHRQRRLRVLGACGSVLTVGVMIFMAGVWMRQPGRFADPRTWDEPGERAIDGLLSVGAIVMGGALLVVLAVHAGLLVQSALRDRATVRALERGERVRLEHVDAVLLDDGPLANSGMVLGVLGWLVASYGWSPTFIAGIEGSDETAAIASLGALALPGLAAVALGVVLGIVGAARMRALRARIQAALLRDPRPLREGESEPTDRRLDAVRDILLHAPGTIT